MRGLAATIAFSIAPAAHAGAWLQPEGHGLVITTMEATEASRVFDFTGERRDGPDFRKAELRVYGEFGLSSKLTLIAKNSWQRIEIGTDTFSASYLGPGDLQLGARVPLLDRGRHRISAEATGGYRFGGEFVAGADFVYAAPTVEARALYGYGWDRAYLDAQVGYRSRLGKGPDTWLADASAGFEIGRLSLLAGASFRTTAEGELFDDTPLLETESLKTRIGASWRTKKNVRLEFARLDTLSGLAHVVETGYSFGVWKTFPSPPKSSP